MPRGEPTAGQRAAARAVRRQRAAKRFTQDQLADASGVSRRTIQYLESMARDGTGSADHFPTLESLIAIEQALGWPPGHLLEIAEAGEQPDPWKDLRRHLLRAMSADDLDEAKEIIADALAVLGPRDPARG